MLPWLTAWARLIVDDDTAANVANRAVARAASRAKRLRGPALRLAARREAASLLARGVAAPPSENSEHAHVGSTNSPTAAATAAPDPREQTAMGRLEVALETLAPHERLACVSYFLDGVSTDAIAALLEVPRERAIRILERAAPTIARSVGESDIPDFSAATDEVEVVTL